MGAFSADVIMNDRSVTSVDEISDLNLLASVGGRQGEAIIADVSVQGVNLMAYEIYRSQARQEQLKGFPDLDHLQPWAVAR